MHGMGYLVSKGFVQIIILTNPSLKEISIVFLFFLDLCHSLFK